MRSFAKGLVLATLLWSGGDAYAGVADTAHNLSASGRGTVRAVEESRVCEFCHTPHNSSPVAALWNRRNPGSSYAPYTSSTSIASPGQPTGASLLCLSCHDGTVALGDVLSRRAPVAMAGGVTTMPPGRGLTGTDLRHHHPISFTYDSGLVGRRGELAMPSALPEHIQLDGAGQMQCTSCHDPHENAYGDFLVQANGSSALCVTCHKKSAWSSNPHATSPATWNGQGRNPWPHSEERTVSSNACRNCHETHQNGGGPNLLRHASEEENCGACHDGSVAHYDVMATIDQISAHPVRDAAGAHDPAETAVVTERHVECSDCHNAHESPVASSGGGGSGAPGVRRRPVPRVRGVNLNNAEVKQPTRGYQVCLRCHGDSPGKRWPRVTRQLEQGNLRKEIQQGNPSFHPIAGPGRNPDVPSLISPLTTQSIIDCVDCHNSNSAPSAGGTGPEGPHGSSIEPILAMNYETTDYTPESPTAYALCYACHSRNSILNNESFQGHDLHIREQQAPCSVCHDPHGISAIQGNQANNSHLINFDTIVVRPNAQGVLRYNDQGRYRGTCDLLCHGRDHQTEGY